MTRRFRFSLPGLVAAAVVAASAAVLGSWQAGRLIEKEAIAERIADAAGRPPMEAPLAPEAGSVHLRRVVVRGNFEAGGTIFLANRIRRGKPGFEVVTPLHVAGTDRLLLVNRGWVAAAGSGDRPPEVATPAGTQTVEGVALERVARAYDPASAPSEQRVRQNLDLDRIRGASSGRVLSWVLEQHSPADDGLLREWPSPDAGIEKHRMYSLQWFGLAFLAVVIYLVLSFRRDAHSSG